MATSTSDKARHRAEDVCRLLLTAAVIVLPIGSLRAQGKVPYAVTVIRTTFCGPFIDADSTYSAKVTSAVAQMGERGRQALLWMARGREDDRLCAFHYLSALSDERVLPLLRKRVSSRSISAAELESVINDLSAFRDQRSVGRVLVLTRNADPRIAGAAIAYLGVIDTEEVRRYLRSLLQSEDSDKLVRVIGAIGRQQDQQAVSSLEELAGKSDVLAYSVAIALGGMLEDPPPESVAVLIRRLPDRETRFRATTQIIEDLYAAQNELSVPSRLKSEQRQTFFERLRQGL